MPKNPKIKIYCCLTECYWNLGKIKGDNCAQAKVVIDDNICEQFIAREEALKRLGLSEDP